MIIKDNTNKTLVIKYLKFLEKNEKQINFDEKESFKDEYEKYKSMFTNEELKLKELKINSHSQKEIFISLLKDIMDLNLQNKDNFKKDVKSKLKNWQLFNQPIDLSNKELYWNRNIFIVYYSLYNIFDDEDKNKDKVKDKLELIQKNIKSIIARDVFKQDYIINNIELLTSIMILIALPQSNLIIEFNLNLIETKDPNYNVEKELTKNNMIKTISKTGDIFYNIKINDKKYCLENFSLCIPNFILNINHDMRLSPIELKNYEEMKKEFNETINLEKMYIFLSKIICSKVFKDAFAILYPDYLKFPFQNEDVALKFLKQYFHFIPLKSLRSGAFTEKCSLEIHLLLKPREINIPSYFEDENKILIEKILYRGSIIKISSHEINHEFYNFFLMHSNGKIPLITPRKKYINENEGGKNMERLLFNKTIKKLSLIECLYLLNIKNYEKSLSEFKEGFYEIKQEDLMFDEKGLFPEFKKISKMDKFEEFSKKSYIRCDEEDGDSNPLDDCYIEDIEDVNDVLGFIREPSKLF